MYPIKLIMKDNTHDDFAFQQHLHKAYADKTTVSMLIYKNVSTKFAYRPSAGAFPHAIN